MNCISVSYKKADVSIRQRLSLSEDGCRSLIRRIVDSGASEECVVLSTCNRTEIYFCGESSGEIISLLAELSDIPKGRLLTFVMNYCGENAIRHLFKVACGMDSMVIGEDEILGQTKRAYLISKEENAAGYETNVVFQAAIACSKRIKTETVLSKTSVSTATLAANEAAGFAERVSVLVIGASGRIGMSTLKNLISHKNVTVRATLRRHNGIQDQLEGLGIQIVDYNDRYKYIADSDCVISATSSPHYTVTSYDLKKYLTDDRKRMFIDLAVPPDIDGAAADLNGVRLVNIDYFQTLAKENNALKISCIDEAERIISEELSRLHKDMRFHEFLPFFEEIRNQKVRVPVEELIFKMKADASAELFSEFLKILQSV